MAGKRAWLSIAAVAGVIVVASGVLVAIRFYNHDSTAGLKVGDCVRFAANGASGTRLRRAACGDADVTAKVVGFAPASDTKACRDIAGASQMFAVGDRVACTGDKNADPATAVNVARPGDCVIMPNPRDAYRHDCADTAAQYVVLQRLEDAPRNQPGGSCAGVAGAIRGYAINWQADDALSRLNAEANKDDQVDQVVLCLGANPQVAAAQASTAASRSPCRFITDADLAAAVSAATGKRYTVESHHETQYQLDCDYVFTGDAFHGNGREMVAISSSPDPYRPGTGDKPFTLDGLPAWFGPGEGNRYICVNVASGQISVMAQLANVGDAVSKAVDIAVFRAARKNIG